MPSYHKDFNYNLKLIQLMKSGQVIDVTLKAQKLSKIFITKKNP